MQTVKSSFPTELNTSDLLYEMICEATANDYESLASIITDVQSWAKSEDQALTKEVISEYVEKMVQSGALNAYIFDKAVSDFVETSFDNTHAASYWFLARRSSKE
jgi:hypothetical protein